MCCVYSRASRPLDKGCEVHSFFASMQHHLPTSEVGGMCCFVRVLLYVHRYNSNGTVSCSVGSFFTPHLEGSHVSVFCLFQLVGNTRISTTKLK